MGNQFLQAALEYESQGWSVVQLEAKGKVPISTWKHLQEKRATQDEIKQWWGKYPEGNVGIICGKISKIAVIDIDNIEKADDRIKTKMPTGYQVSTRNGIHAYYKIPEGITIPSTILLGVELKSEGGLIVAPPSIHPTGYIYSFKQKGEIQPLPKWFINEILQPKAEYSPSSSNDWLKEIWEGVGEGNRNNAATKLAGHYFGKNLSRADILEIMVSWNERNIPPLAPTELQTIINSIEKTHIKNHPEYTSLEAKPETNKKLSTSYPQFPQIAWRGIFEDFRLAHTKTTEAPDEFLFASILVTAGAVIGRNCWTWYARKLYPNSYATIVGTTARSRKTTAAEKAGDLLRRVDPNVLYYRGLASAEGFIEILSPLPTDEEENLDSLLKEGKTLLDEMPSRYKAQKARLEEGVAEFEGVRLLCQIGEFSALLKKSNREGSVGLTEALIDAYDNPTKLDNPTRSRPLTAHNPSVSVIATTTTGRLLRHLAKEEMEGGFANRFCYFIGDRKKPIPWPEEPDLSSLNKVVQKLRETRRRWHNTQFQLLDETKKIWENYYYKWYDLLEGEMIDPVTGRLPDNAIKVALLFAAIENQAPEILPAQMEAAVAVADYWNESIKQLFHSYGLTETQQVEQGILEASSNGGKTREELYDYFSRNIDAHTLNNALENLQKIGKIVQQKLPHEGRGRPRVVFRLRELFPS